MNPSSGSELISDDEKALYDRQIRLWGLEAQNRLRNSRVLLAGLSGCGAEIAKNLVLAGLKSLTLLDTNKVSVDDECCQFLAPIGCIGQNRAEASKERCQMLNPNVRLFVDNEDLITKDEDFFKQFDLVIVVDYKYSVVDRINEICRKHHIRFQAAGVFGWIGYAFSDFNNYSFIVNVKKKCSAYTIDESLDEEAGTSNFKKSTQTENKLKENGKEQLDIPIVDVEEEKIKMDVPFSSWSSALNVDWTHKKLVRKVKRILPNTYPVFRALLRANDSNCKVDADLIARYWKEEAERCGRIVEDSFISEEIPFLLGPQLSPTCAIVGAVVAQEAIKALSQNELPLKNLFLYSSYSTTGVVCSLPPEI
uniref:SUMO-activating enzyme subunit 1 n=1 Tax=Syphacia muris TaxID=451379 RepID=A0A0N5AG07_9BILA